MNRIIVTLILATWAVSAQATDITFTDKDDSSATASAAGNLVDDDVNEIKDAVNSKADKASPTFTGTISTPAISVDPSTAPGWEFEDSDDAAGTATIYGNSSGGTNDVVMSVGVEDSTGESTVYIEVDGVDETVDFLKPTTHTAIQIPSGTTLPGTCTTGQLYVDTDADTDGELYICRTTDTWKAVDDDGAGGMATTDIDTSAEIIAIVGDETGSGALVFGTAPALSNPTGLDANDVGLGNVDNTSNATERAATATLANKTMAAGSNTFTGFPYDICVAASDESTDLTTGTAKTTFRVPRGFTLTDVRASVNTAPVGSTITVDINEAGTTVLSTILSIDASEETSESAATAAVISDSAIADDAEITIDIDQIGSSTAGKGLKVCLIGTISI